MTRKEKLQAIDPKKVIVFDTETTGLNIGGSRRDEILSLAVLRPIEAIGAQKVA